MLTMQSRASGLATSRSQRCFTAQPRASKTVARASRANLGKWAGMMDDDDATPAYTTSHSQNGVAASYSPKAPASKASSPAASYSPPSPAASYGNLGKWQAMLDGASPEYTGAAPINYGSSGLGKWSAMLDESHGAFAGYDSRPPSASADGLGKWGGMLEEGGAASSSSQVASSYRAAPSPRSYNNGNLGRWQAMLDD